MVCIWDLNHCGSTKQEIWTQINCRLPLFLMILQHCKLGSSPAPLRAPLVVLFFFWIQVAFKTETTGFGNPNENQQATYCWWFLNSQCLHNNTSSNLMAYYIYIYKWRNNMEHHIPSPPASPTFHQLQWRSLSAVVPQRPKWMGMPDTSPTKSWLVNDGWWWLMMVDDG